MVGFEITLSRIGTPYMMSYFLPAFGMSCIGSISFLIMPESVPGRVALLLTLMLLLISFFNAIQNQIPKSDGMTAIGLYLLSSLLAVFMALFEYGIILFRMKQRQVEKMKNSSTEIRINAKKVAWNLDNVGMNEAEIVNKTKCPDLPEMARSSPCPQEFKPYKNKCLKVIRRF